MRRTTLSAFAILATLVLAACGSGSSGSDGDKLVRLSINNTTLPAGTVGVAYSAQLTAIGGEAPYSFGVIGTLPAGLMLDASTGAITGTATVSFSGDIEFSVTDANPFTVSRTLNLQLTQPAALGLTASFAPAFTGASYSGAVQATGGVTPYTYSIVSGQLPPGLNLNSSSGDVTGTPTATGSFAITFQVNDSASQSATVGVTLDVAQGVSLFTATSLPDSFVGFEWYARIDASGGLPPYQFSVTGGPAWLQASTEGDGWLKLTGAPTTAGTVNFTVEVTDAVNSVAQAQYSTDATTPLTALQGDSQVVTTSIPRVVVGEYYETPVRASGGFAPYYWSATGLPEGLYFDVNVTNPGILRGRARVAGVYTVTLTAADSVHNSIRSTFDLVVEPSLQFLPDATAGTEYFSQANWNSGGASVGVQLASLGTSGGIDCTLGSGVQLSGTPAASGREVFALQLSLGGKDVIRLVGTDVRASAAALQIHTSQLPDAVAGSAYDYSALIQAEGGSGMGYQWSLVGGTLPPGITGLPATGPAAARLSGSATQTGSYQFTVEVMDSASATAQRTFTINVGAPRHGDVNGDGCPDLIVGSEFQPTNGGLKLFYGEPSKPRFGTIGMEDADWTYNGCIDACRFGDFNGDGVSDIVIGNRAIQGAPAVVKIWYGSRTSPLYGTAGVPDCTITDATTTDQLGSAIATGDLDNDGYDDLVVGARLADNGALNGGVVYVFYGGTSALYGALSKSSSDAMLVGKTPGVQNTYYGYPGSGFLGDSIVVTDFDGDGRDDILAGASSDVYLLYSGATRHSGSIDIGLVADARLTGLVGSILVERLAVGDFNGDSRPDIVVGGYHSYVFYASATGLPFTGGSDAGGASAEILMPHISSTSIYVGVEALDLNGDGFDDIVFCTPENSMGFLFYGGSTKLSGQVSYTAADIELSFGSNDYAPWFAAGVDANNDGTDDLMVGIHNWTAQTASGPVYSAGGIAIINGNSTNPPQGAVTPAATSGLKLIGQLSNHGWGGCGAGG